MVRPENAAEQATQAFLRKPESRNPTAHALCNGVLRLTAPNAGVMTGPGTNTYLVGSAATGYIVVDPGPADLEHLQRLWETAAHANGAGGNIRYIVCTHSHPDHAPGAAPLQALCAADSDTLPPILGLPSGPNARAASHFVPDQTLAHGALLVLGGDNPESDHANHTTALSLMAIHTPGHASNHVCLLLRERGILFSGDHILNGSTTVIDPPDGNMQDYITSLDVLRQACTEHHIEAILPAHGAAIAHALGAIAHIRKHRLDRENRVAAAMQAYPDGTPHDWLPVAYADVDSRLWPIAMRSLLAHVERIRWLKATDMAGTLSDVS